MGPPHRSLSYPCLRLQSQTLPHACCSYLTLLRSCSSRACCRSSCSTSGPTQSITSCPTSTQMLKRSSTAAVTKTRTCRAPRTTTPPWRRQTTTPPWRLWTLTTAAPAATSSMARIRRPKTSLRSSFTAARASAIHAAPVRGLTYACASMLCIFIACTTTSGSSSQATPNRIASSHKVA